MTTWAPPTIQHDLTKVRRDLEDVNRALLSHWASETRDTDTVTAVEALTRAVATLAMAVERIAGLP